MVLFLIDRLRPVFGWLGVDHQQLRAILEVKLLMDTRRRPAMLGQQNAETQSGRSAYWLGLALYVFLGSITGSLIFVLPSLYWAATLVFSYIMVMTVMSLITDFASVLMDTTDQAVLSPRPLDNRTVWLARLIHVAAYVLSLTCAISLASWVFAGLRYGWEVLPLFAVLVLLSAFLAVFFTTLLYLLLIRFSDAARIRQMITYAQVGFSVLFVSAYQLLPRLVDWDDLGSLGREVAWWHYLAPPFWMGGVMEAFVNRHFEAPYQIFAVLALGCPVAALLLMNGAVSRTLTRRLAEMNTAPGTDSPAAAAAPARTALSERLATWLTSSPAERMAFELTWKMTGRDQKFKLRTYPSLGVLVPIFFSYFQGGQFGTETWQYILMLYFTSFLVGSLLSNSHLSDDHAAAWMYQAAPVGRPGGVLLGSFKAVLAKLFVPLYAVLAAVVVWFWGWGALGDIGLAFCNNLLFAVIFVLASAKRLPFSHAPSQAQQSASVGVAFLLIFISTVVGLAHFGLAQFPTAVWAAIPVVGALVFYLMRQYGRTSWAHLLDAPPRSRPTRSKQNPVPEAGTIR